MSNRVLVGILWSGEPQVRRMMESLIAQQGVQLDYFIISGLGKMEAHNRLYGMFNEHRDQMDLLAKVDADMILNAPTLFARACEFMRANPSIDVLTIPVHDYFIDGPLVGMNMYRPATVRWEPRADEIFTDKTSSEFRTVVTNLDLTRPVDHCPMPDDFQAFHFGVHRGVKLRHAIDFGEYKYASIHIRTLNLVGRAAKQNRTRGRVLAYLGFVQAMERRFAEEHIPYSNPVIATHLQDYGNVATHRLHLLARLTRLRLTVASPRTVLFEALRLARSSARHTREGLKRVGTAVMQRFDRGLNT
jgi:hypothetical protein